MNRSIKLMSIMGIPITVNYTWFIVFFLISWTLAVNIFPSTEIYPGNPVYISWILGMLSALIFFITLLAHEFSHSIVAKMNGLPVKGITLFIFGGVAHLGSEPQTPSIEFKMAIAGPLCSFAISFFSFMLYLALSNLSTALWIKDIILYISGINLIVGVFNLIPGFPLDGGRVLRSVIWQMTGNLRLATKISTLIGRFFAYVLMAIGFLYIFRGAFLSGIWLVFIGFFLQEAAVSSYEQVVLKNALTGATVEELMSKNIISVFETVSLYSLVEDYFFKYRHTSFPVLTHDGDIRGLITIHAVKDVQRDVWPTISVVEAMIPVRSNMVISPHADAFDALTIMAGNGIGRLLVLSPDKKIIGMISRRDVMKLFEVKSDLEP